MKFGLLKQYVRLKYFFQHKIDRKFVIFMFFLLISTFFWLLNALSKEYTTSINFPVRFTNFPKNKVLIGNLPGKMEINVKSYGFTLLKYKLKPVLPPLNFDLRSITFHSKNNNSDESKYYILTRYEVDKIDRQLSNEIHVVGISPDTIHLQFVNVVNKKVPVQQGFKVSFAKQFMQHGNLVFNPDSIIITGPNTILDTINAVFTRNKTFENLNETLETDIDLESIKNVKIPKSKVKFVLPVEKYTETQYLVPIQIINLPDTLNMTIFPKELKVSYLVALSDYEKVKGFMFRAVVDYGKVEKSMNDKLKIELESKPDFVRSVKHFPLNIDYIIEN